MLIGVIALLALGAIQRVTPVTDAAVAMEVEKTFEDICLSSGRSSDRMVAKAVALGWRTWSDDVQAPNSLYYFERGQDGAFSGRLSLHVYMKDGRPAHCSVADQSEDVFVVQKLFVDWIALFPGVLEHMTDGICPAVRTTDAVIRACATPNIEGPFTSSLEVRWVEATDETLFVPK